MLAQTATAAGWLAPRDGQAAAYGAYADSPALPAPAHNAPKIKLPVLDSEPRSN